MTAIGITGADGFLGWHLRCRLRALQPEIHLVPVGRAVFGSSEALDVFVSSCDRIFHLAGANRGSETNVAETNIGLAHRLVDSLKRTNATPAITYSNSTQSNGDSAYGRSKREAARLLAAWSAEVEVPFNDVVLPNLFGEHGRPFYNSVIATFCHQLVRKETVKVNAAGVARFLHVQDAAQLLIDAMESKSGGESSCDGESLTVPEIYERLSDFQEAYRGQYFPKLANRLDLQFFNTLRSYRFPDYYPMELQLHSDPRGGFVELSRGYGPTQVSVSYTKPDVTRGDHFHLEKIERFVVLDGEAVIKIRRLFDERVHSFHVDGAEPKAVDMPTMHTHSIRNVGSSDLLTAFWANDHFDPYAPDTFVEPVECGINA